MLVVGCDFIDVIKVKEKKKHTTHSLWSQVCGHLTITSSCAC